MMWVQLVSLHFFEGGRGSEVKCFRALRNREQIGAIIQRLVVSIWKMQPILTSIDSLKLTDIAPENRPPRKETSSSNFQPLIFRCELLVLTSISFPNWVDWKLEAPYYSLKEMELHMGIHLHKPSGTKPSITKNIFIFWNSFFECLAWMKQRDGFLSPLFHPTKGKGKVPIESPKSNGDRNECLAWRFPFNQFDKFSPLRWSNLTDFFLMGWNHRLARNWILGWNWMVVEEIENYILVRSGIRYPVSASAAWYPGSRISDFFREETS